MSVSYQRNTRPGVIQSTGQSIVGSQSGMSAPYYSTPVRMPGIPQSSFQSSLNPVQYTREYPPGIIPASIHNSYSSYSNQPPMNFHYLKKKALLEQQNAILKSKLLEQSKIENPTPISNPNPAYQNISNNISSLSSNQSPLSLTESPLQLETHESNQAQQQTIESEINSRLSSPLSIAGSPINESDLTYRPGFNSFVENLNTLPTSRTTHSVSPPSNAAIYIPAPYIEAPKALDVESPKKQSVRNDRDKIKKQKPVVSNNIVNHNPWRKPIVRPRERLQKPGPPKYIDDIGSLLTEVTKIVDDNTTNLSLITRVNNSKIPLPLLRKDMKREEEAKRRLQSILKQYDRINSALAGDTRHFELMPLWRHKLLDYDDPPPEKVLKGVRLLRVIVLGVMAMYCEPKIKARHRKLNSRIKDLHDWSRTMTIFMDSCSTWIGKLIRVPLQSLDQDSSLDFSSLLSSKPPPNTSHREKLLQIKVRIKSVVKSLYSSDALHIQNQFPVVISGSETLLGFYQENISATDSYHVSVPDHILDFLVAYIDDGKYFPSNYFMKMEKQILSFNELGATRNVLNNNSQDEEDENFDMPNDEGFYLGYSIENAIILIRNFLLLRILINRVILSPWQLGICSRPQSIGESHRMLSNYRIFAGIIYMILQHDDPTLPNLVSEKHSVNPGLINSEIIFATNDGNVKDQKNKDLFSVFNGLVKSVIKGSKDKSSTALHDVSHDNDSNIERSLLHPREPLESIEASLQKHILPAEAISNQDIESYLEFKNFAWSLKLWTESIVVQVLERKHALDQKKYSRL